MAFRARSGDVMKTPGRPRATESPAVATILRLLAGPIVWALHFTAIYGFQSLACDRRVGLAGTQLLDLDAVELFSVAATIIAVVVLALAGFAPRHSRQGEGELQDFVESTARLLILLSTAGILLVAATALVIPACPSLR
jgi:hypothetical protein